MYDVATVSVSNITSGAATLSGEVTSLDKSTLDAVCAFFEYGTNSDLSNATEISGENHKAIFTDGGGAYSTSISGLSASTQYYFRAKGRLVKYQNSDAMDYVAQRRGFMNDLAQLSSEMSNVAQIEAAMSKIKDYSVAMDEVTTSATAMTECAATEIGFRNLCLSSEAINTLWSSAESEKIWTNATTFVCTGDDSYTKSWWERTIDVTNLSTIYLKKKIEDVYGNGYTMKVKLDYNELYSESKSSSDSSYVTLTLDVSAYNGEMTLRIESDIGDDVLDMQIIYVIGPTGNGIAMRMDDGYPRWKFHYAELEFA